MSRAGAAAQARARRLWLGFETLHAVTYFHPTCLDAMAAAGTKGFWMGYFAGRLAPMGAVGPGTATAVCFGFAPARPARALPDAWSHVEPARAIEVRATGAAAALRETVPDVEARAAVVVATLEHLVGGLAPAGRPLAAGNLDLTVAGAVGEDPVARLWQACTALREHRGDGHVAAWVAAGCSGLEANVLSCAAAGRDPEDLLASRGWSPVEWLLATTALHARGLLTLAPAGAGELEARATDAGHALHDQVEATTDALAAASYTAVGARALDDLADALVGMGADVSAAGALRYPNPIGLPPAS